MNLQVIASPDGDIMWVRGAARLHPHHEGRLDLRHRDELAAAGLVALADKGYQGAAHAKPRTEAEASPSPRNSPTRRTRTPGSRRARQRPD